MMVDASIEKSSFYTRLPLSYSAVLAIAMDWRSFGPVGRFKYGTVYPDYNQWY